MSSPLSLGTRILGGAATILMIILAIGWLLPATWEAEASSLVQASPEETFAFIDSPAGWRAWTVWPDEGVEVTGPARGAGSGFAWESRELGDGVFTIVDVQAPRSVSYRVEIGGGAMITEGSVRLSPEGSGTRVEWRESGNLGRNPLMGYWARSMNRAQSDELAKGLDALAAAVSDSTGFVRSR